jgi:hypothetical protein
LPIPEKRTKWSYAEKEKLFNGLKRYGRDWKKIADEVQTRTKKGCSNFIENLKPEEFNALDADVR